MHAIARVEGGREPTPIVGIGQRGGEVHHGHSACPMIASFTASRRSSLSAGNASIELPPNGVIVPSTGWTPCPAARRASARSPSTISSAAGRRSPSIDGSAMSLVPARISTWVASGTPSTSRSNRSVIDGPMTGRSSRFPLMPAFSTTAPSTPAASSRRCR